MVERVLMTGGAGYLGSVLTKHLLDNNYAVTCLDNLLYHQQTPFLFADHPQFTFVYGDIRNKETMKPLIAHHDILLPLAALVGESVCKKRPDDATSTNCDAVIMLNTLRSSEQKFIYPNTNSGYGTKSGETCCTEETPLEPISLYGTTKVDAEKELFRAGKDVISLRLATVFGISPRMRLDLLVNDFVYKAMTDGYLVVYQPHFKRNFIHIKDVARAFEHCIAHFQTMKNNVYNVGLDNANLSKLELAKKIKDHIQKFEIIPREIGEDPDKRNYLVSNEKIQKTRFIPAHSLDEGIQQLIKGYAVVMFNNPYKNA